MDGSSSIETRSIAAQSIIIANPPPPYAAMPITIPLTASTFSQYSDDEDSDYDERQVTSTEVAPITIMIDASITMKGQSNTLILPPSFDPCVERTSASATRAFALRALQHKKTEHLTSAVLVALQEVGAFGAGREGRPLNVKINAGVSLKGTRNVVATSGVRLYRKEQKAPDVSSRKRRASSVSRQCFPIGHD